VAEGGHAGSVRTQENELTLEKGRHRRRAARGLGRIIASASLALMRFPVFERRVLNLDADLKF